MAKSSSATVTSVTDRKRKAFGDVTERLAVEQANSPAGVAAHIASVQEQIDAIGRGDFEGALRSAASDITLEIYAPPEFPFVCRAQGVAEVLNAIKHNFAAVEDQKPTISNVLAHGDVVVIFGTEDGRIRETGTQYRVEFVHRFSFVDRALQSIRIIAARRT